MLYKKNNLWLRLTIVLQEFISVKLKTTKLADKYAGLGHSYTTWD